MKAVRFNHYGGPEVLEVTEVPRPAPSAGEVLVAVVAAATNPGEIGIREGRYATFWPAHFPEGQGNDFAGRIVEKSHGATEFEIGDEVIGFAPRRAQSQYVAIGTQRIAPKPADLPWEAAATIAGAGATAWASVAAVDPRPGETIVVSAAAGGVGVYAAQLARLRGAEVIGTCSVANFERLAGLGIRPVQYGPELAQRLRDLAPDGIDGFIDTFGAGNVAMAVDLGVLPHRINTLIDHEAVRRFGVHSEAQEQADTPQVWSALAALVARGDVTVPISEVYRFTTDEVRRAYREVGTRRVTGKRVLRIMSSSELTSATHSTSQKVNTPMSHYENSEEAGLPDSAAEAAKAVVRRNTEQVQGQGDFALFDELFAEDFVDHTPQPGTTADKAGVLVLYKRLRAAFPDFRPEIGWQTVDGDIVTTYKVYHGTHQGDFLGIAGTGRSIAFETVDAMRVRDGKITDHWGVANLYSVLQQLDQLPTEPNGGV